MRPHFDAQGNSDGTEGGEADEAVEAVETEDAVGGGSRSNDEGGSEEVAERRGCGCGRR